MALAPSKLLPFALAHRSLPPSFPYPRRPGLPYPCRQTLRISCAKRTGKQRYPSEKKKLKLRLRRERAPGGGGAKDKFEGIWRLSKLAVPVRDDPGKDFLGVSDGLLQEIAKVLEFPVKLIVFLSLLVLQCFSGVSLVRFCSIVGRDDRVGMGRF